MSIEIDDRFQLFEVAAWLEQGLEAILVSRGLPLPQHTGKMLAAAGCRVMRITPRLAWVLADADAVLSWAPTNDGVAVDLSNSRVRFRLTGRAAQVLPRLVAVDFASSAFVASMMHGIPVTILRANDGFEVLVPRTFSTSLIEWIEDAMAGGHRALPSPTA